MSINQFDFNLLRALDVLVVECNVTRAAEKLCVTQQAMSGTLQRLREYFDDPLLVRVGRHMELTPLAVALQVPVREALLKIGSVLATEPNFDPAVVHRHYRIAMSDYVTLAFLPLLLRKLAKEAPYITCNIEHLTGNSFSLVESGDLDFCISANNRGLYEHYEPSLEINDDVLFVDDFVSVVDQNHTMIDQELTIEQYKVLPHTVVGYGNGVLTLVEQGWAEAKLNLNIAATAPSFSTMLFMLPGTQLIATAQRRLARRLCKSLSLKFFECPVAIKQLQESLIWHGRNKLDPGHKYMRRAIKEVAKSLGN